MKSFVAPFCYLSSIHRSWPALSLLAAGLLAPAAEAQPGGDLAAMLRTPGAVQARVRFDHLTSVEGLTHDSVFSILQDRHGFMWFGTQGGLNRYDGYSVTQYLQDPHNPNSMGGDFVQFLFEDSTGNIWCGRNTLSRFDPTTETFTRYDLPAGTGERGVIWAMREDRFGRLWVAISGDLLLYRLDPKTGQYTAFKTIPNAPAGVSETTESLHVDTAGILWVGTSHGLVRFDPATGSSRNYPQGNPNPKIPVTRIRGIAQDGNGKLWLATNEGALNFFDPVAGVLSRRWAAPDPAALGTDINNTMATGPDGILWLGTVNGLQAFDPATGTAGVLRHHPADRFSLSANEIWATTIDRDGDLWVGTKGGGVNRFSPAAMRFGAWRRDPADSTNLSEDNVRSIYRDRAGQVWIGTYGGGLNRLDLESGRFKQFRHDSRNLASLDDDRVYSIYEDRSGSLWIGTGVGVNRLDRNTGKFTRFTRGSLGTGGSNIPTYSLLEDRTGRFWFGAGYHKGQLDRGTGEVSSFTDDGGLSIFEDHEGSLWFGAISGLSKMDRAGIIRKINLEPTPGTGKPRPVQINFMHQDADGILWLAAETGLIRLDPKTDAPTRFSTADGLPNNVVQCIVPDREGNLWLSTNGGLSRFNPRDRSFTNYHESDGLQGEQFNRKACFVDEGGVMYFGGAHGFNIFDPRRVPPAAGAPSRVVLTGLRVHGDVVPVRAGSVLPRPIWDMQALTLSHADDAFSLEFASLSYKDQARTRYRFRLEGLETKWTEVDNRNRSARYTGLRSGSYRFRVQSSSDGRTWGAQEASLAISIAPPWWMTWWSLGGAILAVTSLLFGAYKLRVRALYRQGLELQKVVDQRTAELVEARDQAEQANRAKGAFLANMSHELRTPLNAILGFSNILRDSSDSEDQRRDLDIINRSGEHLLTLIDDVLDGAKIESGRIVLAIGPCDLKALVEDVANLMRVRAAEKHLALKLVQSAELPRYIRSDAVRLREVLINLVGNALKYTEQGSVTLRLDGWPAGESEHVTVCFEVEDTGIGIALEDQERIFQPFERASGSYQKGTGLGLTIARRVLELMGGRIEVQSTPGKGSCFRVELPVERAQESEVKPEAARERILGLEAGQPEYRILVVEDEPENSMVLERLLREAGFQVRVAENGEQGVEGFRAWRPQFIWMDLRMPVMDGIEAVSRIRDVEDGRDVKIAAVTASGFESKRSAVMAAGFDDYLRKPYRPDEIFECMARHLGVRYRRALAEPVSYEKPTVELRPDALAALPASLRTDLRNALVALDLKLISRTIQKVTEHDAALGSVLAQNAKRYSFTAMLSAVEGVKDEASASSA